MRGRDTKQAGDKPPRRSAYDKALALLARREQSRHELHAKLARDGYDNDEIDDALARLGEAHYQDDARFAEMLVRSRTRQGYGPMRLRAELKSHGIDGELIGTVLDEADAETDWTALAADQLQRRYGSKPANEYTERVRRMQFLQRRGFDGGTARAAVGAHPVRDGLDAPFET
ncbi:MAG TPA: regulatory protein RecX [Oleiagrimonas sp.]|nr:regulatory protein RecX [Oleiagrimonas sp.]